MDELEQFKQTYFQECEELLADMENHLLTLEEDGSNMEALHAVFRAIHSIKGGGGAFGFERLVAFAHKFETVLDQMREGALETSPENLELAVRAADVVADLVRAAQGGAEVEPGHEDEIAAILNGLCGSSFAGGESAGGEGPDDDDMDFVPIPVDAAPAAGPSAGDEAKADVTTYHITLVPHSGMLQRANEPLLLIRELKQLGTVKATADLSRLPPLDDMDPEAAYLGWKIELITASPRDAVDEVFEFVVDDCDLQISTGDADIETTTAPPRPASESRAPSPPPPPAPPPAPAPTAREPAPAVVATKPAAAAAAGRQPAVNSVRVDLEKMDRMVNMVGELVITQAMLAQQINQLPPDEFPELLQGLEELSQHTRELQDGVMAMRAQPVKSVFQRIPRLVRELSAQTGKKIRLIMIGENTEIDKTVIEQIGDPLTHMIRNAVDHGVETPEDRERAGKSSEGTILLSSEHRGGRIVIEIQDDGRGINRDRVMRKAIEKGLVSPNSVLSDEEIDGLIFHPGFSTAETVSSISGRGVGMDVVLRNIQNLGGRVMVRSTPGHGSIFSLSLPLTLAVLDGMVVRSGGQTYVIPLANIVESLRPAAGDIHCMAGNARNVVMSLRGEYIQLIFLHRVLNIEGALDDPSNALVVVAETEGGSRVGVVVDEILGQQQVVIKTLEENYDPIAGIAGATILGSGKVALILDISGLKNLTDQEPSARGPSRLPSSPAGPGTGLDSPRP